MKHVAIIGGGASGFAAAITVARQRKDLHVTIFERLEKPLKKILATGNGRCNLTNSTATKADYFGNTSYAAAALSAFPPQSTIAFFESMGLLCKEEELGRVYPLSGQAASVREILLAEAKAYGVQLESNLEIQSISQQKDGTFLLNQTIPADVVVLAFGGKAAPKHGTDGSAYALFAQLGIPMVQPRPALTALTCKDFPKSLKGVRNVSGITLLCDGKPLYTINGEVQFTDYGLSGVPIMQLSRLVEAPLQRTYTVKLSCLPHIERSALQRYIQQLQKSAKNLMIHTFMAGLLPKALGDFILHRAHIQKEKPLGALSFKEIETLLNISTQLTFQIAEPRGFDFAQVTAGGADCRAFYKSTLASKQIAHLYACGEALDVDGGCGGYNLQWAFSSGRMVGDAISKGEFV